LKISKDFPNGQTKFLGLIGFPIKHSLSPQIHNYLFRKYSLNYIYGCFEVRHLKEAVKGLFNLGFVGFNVTIPYKEKIISYLDRVDKEAEVIGAVNTVRVNGEGLAGFNTDGRGFLKSLEKFSFTPQGKAVLILGAGGGAKAAATYLAKAKVKRIAVYDIIYKKSISLKNRIEKFFPKIEVITLKEKKEISLREFDLVVNATGVGLKKEDPSPIKLEGAKKHLVVYDLIYNPLLTSFLKEAKKKKLLAINGLWMLIWQALEAEKIWLGINFYKEASTIYQILTRYLRKC